MNNFATLVAIISGLSNDWVRKAMRRSWNRVGKWETRVYEDLRAFCTAEDDFRYIRRAIAALVDAKPLTANGQEESTLTSSSTSDVTTPGSRNRSTDGKVAPPTSCVPFIGEFVLQNVTRTLSSTGNKYYAKTWQSSISRFLLPGEKSTLSEPRFIPKDMGR